MMKKLETMGAAIAFAEANELDAARDIMAELETTYRSSKRKIVLVSNDAPIRPGFVEYALGLAARTQADTMFLSVLSGKKRSARSLKSCKEAFRKIWEKLLAAFPDGDEPDGIHEHVVLVGEMPQLVMEVCRRLGHVEMVIVQKRPNESCSLDLSVPVFCFDQ